MKKQRFYSLIAIIAVIAMFASTATCFAFFSADSGVRNVSISEATGDDEIEKLMNELNALYDEYNTKLALNDTKAAEEVRAKIELKKAEVDKQMGVTAIA